MIGSVCNQATFEPTLASYMIFPYTVRQFAVTWGYGLPAYIIHVLGNPRYSHHNVRLRAVCTQCCLVCHELPRIDPKERLNYRRDPCALLNNYYSYCLKDDTSTRLLPKSPLLNSPFSLLFSSSSLGLFSYLLRSNVAVVSSSPILDELISA